MNLVAYESFRDDADVHDELNFFADKPAQPCLDAARAKSDGMTLPFKARTVAAGPIELVGRPIVRRREPSVSYMALDDSNAANVTVVLDAVDRKRRPVKGRVYVAIDDSGKSLLAGAFTATYCAEPAP